VFGSAVMDLVFMLVSKCIATMNSVWSNAPVCSLSDSIHIRPNTSFGSPDFSNIAFAVPASNCPFCAPDFSNSPEYCCTFCGSRGGTRIGAWPLNCGCRAPGGAELCKGLAGVCAAPGIVMPSNLGMGPCWKASSVVGSLPAW
jgi:hypothetical protein